MTLKFCNKDFSVMVRFSKYVRRKISRKLGILNPIAHHLLWIVKFKIDFTQNPAVFNTNGVAQHP